MITIRTAVDSDLDTLRGFEQQLIDVERAFDRDLKAAGVRYYDLESLLAGADSEVAVAVAVEGETVLACGYVQLRDAKAFYTHARVGYIGFLFVVPSARGHGLVRRVIDALCDWTRAQGVEHVELGVYSENAAAIAAYERAGFAAISTTMIKAI
ncbi:MAG: GNAT family N-acetyltransferase [Pseudomonadota bacterium]